MIRTGSITAVVLGVAAGASACVDLADIPRGTCGNYVVEVTPEGAEDCDSHDDVTCRDCTWTCQPSVIGPDPDVPPGCGQSDYHVSRSDPAWCCPEGYECGADDLCYKPSGRFRPTVEGLELPIDTLAIAQVDLATPQHEVVGLAGSRVRVLSIGASGAVEHDQSLMVDATSTWAVADLDGGGAAELITASADGIVAFSGSQGELATYPFTTFVIGDRDADTSTQLPRVTLIAGDQEPEPIIVVERQDDSLCGQDEPPCATILTADDPNPEIPWLPCGSAALSTEDLVGDRIAIRSIGSGRALLALGFRSSDVPPDPPDDVLCVYGVQAPPLVARVDLGMPTLLALPAGHRLGDGNLVFATLGSEACPSLLVPLETVPGGTLSIGVAAMATAGPCTIDPAVVQVPGSAGAVPVLADELFAGGGDEIVTSAGIASLTPGLGYAITDPSPRPWHSAAIGDVNRDGLPDVIAASPVLEASDNDGVDVDVLRQRPTGGFTPSRIFTTGPVDLVRAADVDGDLHDDVVFVELYGTYAILRVAFGAPAGGPPVQAVGATFPEVADLITTTDIGLPSANGIAKVIVATRAGGTVLFGSFTRQMTAPLIVGETDPTLAHVLVANIDGDAFPDLVAFHASTPIAPADDMFLLRQEPPKADPGMGGPVAQPPLFRQLDTAMWPALVEIAALVAVRLPEAARDTLVGIKRGVAELVVMTIVPDVTTSSYDLELNATLMLSTGSVGIEEVRVVDFDEDQQPELLIDFAEQTGTNMIPRSTWRFELGTDALGSVIITEYEELLASDTLGSCATSAIVTTDAGRELVVGCADGVRASTALATMAPAEPRQYPDVLDVDQLAVGDLTGDGVDDVAVLAERGTPTLSIFIQCTTRDPAPCDPAAGPGTGIKEPQ